MVRRTRAQSKTDDLAFPVRVKFCVPVGGLGGLHTRLHLWLADELGSRRYAVHSATGIGGQMFAVYFRSADEAKRCIEAFPELQLADGVTSPAYYSPAGIAGPRISGA